MATWIPMQVNGLLRADAVLYVSEFEGDVIVVAMPGRGCPLPGTADQIVDHLRRLGLPLLECQNSLDKRNRLWVNLDRASLVVFPKGKRTGPVHISFECEGPLSGPNTTLEVLVSWAKVQEALGNISPVG